MSLIRLWGNTADGNSVAAPDGFLKRVEPTAGIKCGSVDDSFREVMASIRAKHELAEWADFGHSQQNPLVLGSGVNQFELQVTWDPWYKVYAHGRRIRLKDNGVYRTGTIIDSAKSAAGNVRLKYVYDSTGSPDVVSVTEIAVSLLYDASVAGSPVWMPFGHSAIGLEAGSTMNQKLLVCPMQYRPASGFPIDSLAVICNSSSANFNLAVAIGRSHPVSADSYAQPDVPGVYYANWVKERTLVANMPIVGSGIKIATLDVPLSFPEASALYPNDNGAYGFWALAFLSKLGGTGGVGDLTWVDSTGGGVLATVVQAFRCIRAGTAVEPSFLIPTYKLTSGTVKVTGARPPWIALLNSEYRAAYDAWLSL